MAIVLDQVWRNLACDKALKLLCDLRGTAIVDLSQATEPYPARRL
jgi:hypothetical protein